MLCPNTLISPPFLKLNAGSVATFTVAATQQGAAGAATTFNGGSMRAIVGNGYVVQTGSLTGSASGSTITGNLTNSGGTVDAGGTTGVLSISGKYTQNSGTLAIGVDFTAKTNSSLAVGGQVSLADTLNVNFAGFPGRGTTWTIITYGATAGSDFATFTSNNGLKYVHVKPDVNNTYVIQIPNLQGQGKNINDTEGQDTGSVVVTNFTDPSGDPNNTGFTAQINWGDGSQPTAGTVIPDGMGGWNVFGDHTYTEEGSYPITVTVTPDDDPNYQAPFAGTATVTEAAISATGQNQSATVGVPFSGVVATITDSNPFATASDFTATIYWPDTGSTSPGTISAGSGGTFLVSGSHTFTLPGSWQARVSIQDDGGAGANAVSVISVTGGYGGGGRSATTAASPALTTAVSPAVGTTAFFAIPVASAMLVGTEFPAAAPLPGAASDPRSPAASAPPITSDAAPNPPTGAFDPLAAYPAVVATPDPAAGPLGGPLSGPDAYFASLS